MCEMVLLLLSGKSESVAAASIVNGTPSTVHMFILIACITVVMATHIIVCYFGGIVDSTCDFLICKHLLRAPVFCFFFFPRSHVPSMHLFHTLAEDAASPVQM